MMWAYLIAAAVVAIPLMVELTRKRMNAAAREAAPGSFATLSQGVTHYQWHGPADGPVAICIHGLTTPSFVWQSVAEGLTRLGFRVLTYDLYGRGWSDRPSGTQGSDFFNRQLNDLLEDQQIEDDITLVGYSMGGAIATAFAARQPLAIRQLVMIAPAGMLQVATGGIAPLLRLPVIGTWLMLLLYPNKMRRGIAAERDLPGSIENIAGRQESELEWRGFTPSVAASLRGILTEDMQQAHQTLQEDGVPVLAIWGREDDVIPAVAAEKLGDWNPTALNKFIEGAGHGLTYTHTPEILDHIARFTSRNG